MPVSYRITADGFDKVQRLLRQLQPPESTKATNAGLLRSAFLVERRARDVEIAGGGNLGGGKQLRPLPHRLTSRRGGAGLRGSISVNRSRLPRSVDIGTHLKYGAVHEQQGRTGTKLTVRKVSSKGKPYTATYPARPFLGPALRKKSPEFTAIFLDEISKRIRR